MATRRLLAGCTFMADYWLSVIFRSWTESWAFLTGLDTVSRIVLAVCPFVVGAAIYLRMWGIEMLKREHLRPAIVVALSYLAIVLTGFLFNIIRVPSVIQQETEAARFRDLQEQHERAIKSHDVELRGSTPTGSDSLTPLEAAELIQLRDKVKEYEEYESRLSDAVATNSRLQDQLRDKRDALAVVATLEPLQALGDKVLAAASRGCHVPDVPEAVKMFTGWQQQVRSALQSNGFPEHIRTFNSSLRCPDDRIPTKCSTTGFRG